MLAAETLANHVRGNRSFVQAVFQAQFRSSLACPQCHRQSNTFDPFHCISVQLPQQHVQLPVYVTVRYAAQHPRQVRLGLSIAAGAPVSALRAQLQTDTGIPAGRMVLVELADDVGFGRVLADAYTLDTAANLYCMETPAVQSTTNGHGGGGGVAAAAAEAADRDARKCDGLLTVLVANARRTDTAVQRFGTPFCVEIRRDVTYAELQKRLLKEMQHVLRPDVFAYAVQPSDLFRMRLQDPSADNDAYMVPRVEHPLFMEMVDLALVVLAADAGPPHVKLLLEWREPERFFTDMTDDAVEHESVTLVRGAHQAQAQADGNGAALSLEQCLEHYTRAETLGAEDAWRCPHCQQYLPVVKTLGLWSLPEILVIHFKRFASHQDHHSATAPTDNGHSTVPPSNSLPRTAAKLTTSVTFPLTGFDMTPHLAQQQRLQKQPTQNGHRMSSGLSGTSSASPDNGNDSSRDQNLYDLYAVCYHQGETLETGHYTAACKNPYDLQWYRFDDQKVTAVPGGERTAAEIVNNEAYILFYQRRVAAAAGGERSGASTTVNGSLSTGLSTLGLSEHWVSRIAPVPPVSPMSSSISQGSIGLSFATAAEPDRVHEVVASNVAGAAELDVLVSSDEPASDACNPVEADVVTATESAASTLKFICDEPEREPTLSMPEDVVSQLPALTTNAITETTSTLATSTFEEPQFAELCQNSVGTSGSEESPQPSPPMRLRTHPPINRGSLSFSEVFRRRESPLLNSMCVSRHSADHRSFLTEDVAAAAMSTSTSAQMRNGGGGSSGGGGSGSASSFMLVDNRSASWVS